MKWKENYFFLLVQHCWTWSIVIVVVLGDVCKTAGAHCLQEEIGRKWRRGTEGAIIWYRSTHPCLPLFNPHVSGLVSPSYHPWCFALVQAGKGVYGLTSCCFLHAFLIKKKRWMFMVLSYWYWSQISSGQGSKGEMQEHLFSIGL